MRKIALLVVLGMLVFGLISGSGASADSICMKTGLRIMGEPWLAHTFCMPCPDAGCPGSMPVEAPDLDVDPDSLPVELPSL